MVFDVLTFAATGAAVVLAAVALSRSADVIAERTGLGGLWIGAVLLAAATSLPELVTDVAAVRMGAADLAAGDLFGSSMANMLILALVDLLPPRVRVLQRAALDHALAACLALTLNGLAAAFVLAQLGVAVLGVSPGSVVLAGVFLAGTHALFRHRPWGRADEPAVERPAAAAAASTSTARAVVGFAAAATAIVVAAPLFAGAAKRIAEASGLSLSFVGTLLVGLSTSLPELVASIAAVRMRAYDLAVGNLFGSNSFNMVLFLAMDLAAPDRPIFAMVSPVHAISAVFATVLMAIALAAIVLRTSRRGLFEPGAVAIVLGYALALYFVYSHGAG